MSEVRAAPIFFFAIIFRVLLHFSSADPNIFLLGSVITSEVGLRVLLCPLGSNIVIRTACCSVGVALPVYSTFKAIETKDQNAQQRCLLYWAAYGSFSLIEVFSDKFLSWYSAYVISPEVCISYLASTSIHQWSKTVICEPSAPFLVRHQTRVDRVVGLVYSVVVKLISSYQREIQFVRTMPVKITGSDRTQEYNPEIIQPDRSNQNSPADEPATSSDSEPDRNHNT